MVVIALPFLWIGVSMSMRRASDAGLSPWVALLFFVPGLNLLLMLVLSLLSSHTSNVPLVVEAVQVSKERMQSAMLGVAASLGITLLSVGIGVYLRQQYSAGLFLGVPFTIGYISSYIYNSHADRRAGESIGIAVASVTIASLAMILFALEGAVCIVMAAPIALVVAWPGAVLGRAMARRASFVSSGAGIAVLVPLFLGAEPRLTPPSHEVLTVVEIAAPPHVVWRHVVSFPDLQPPAELLFRAGVARTRVASRLYYRPRTCVSASG